MRSPLVIIALASALLAGCGSDAPASDSASGGQNFGGFGASAGSGANGGSGGSSASSSGGTAGKPAGPVELYASFLPETTAGNAPALLSLKNDTKERLSLWLGQAWFDQIVPFGFAGPDLSASTAVRDDAEIGVHAGLVCVTYRLKTVTGPDVLDPGKAYTMAVSSDPVLGWSGDLKELAPPPSPYVTVRAKIRDPNPGGLSASELSLELPGQRHGAFFQVYDGAPTDFQWLGDGDVTVGVVHFESQSGDRYESLVPVTLSGAPGFTVLVDVAPVDGAPVIAPLARLP